MTSTLITNMGSWSIAVFVLNMKFWTKENYQGNAVVNYTEREIPYTRIIEHKHFEYGTQPKTVITREYPADWKRGDEPYYPINDEKEQCHVC